MAVGALLGSGGAAGGSGAGADGAAAWLTFTTPDGAMSILMPREPVRADDTVRTPIGRRAVVRFQARDGHGLFDAGYLERDKGGLGALAGDARLLDSACRGTAKHMGGTIVETSAVVVDGHDGRDLEVAFPDTDRPHAHARIVITEARVYHAVLTPDDALGAGAAAAFVGSMRLHGSGGEGR